jgi:hypothetical protein
MKKLTLSEIKNIHEYEKVRDDMRAKVIDLKRDRRLSVGDNVSLLFENRQTVLFQVQEMVRTERIVADDKIQDELDAYNGLIPEKDELSATLFLEIPEIAHMTSEQVRASVGRFQGLDREGVWLKAGRSSLAAQFEGGESHEEKMAAIHYVKFAISREARAALADPAQPVQLVIDHPNYRAQADVPPPMREQLLKDLAEPSS